MSRKYLKFKDYLAEKLHDPVEAQAFLDAAIQEYEEDKDIEALLLALRYLAEAQGGVPRLSERTHLNRQNLYKILTGKTAPGFDTMISIIRGLGYHLATKNKKHNHPKNAQQVHHTGTPVLVRSSSSTPLRHKANRATYESFT